MFKRFACMILSLVLLVGLIPAMAIPASAASNAVSDNAITILKKLETFSNHCDENGFIGYGTKCTEKGAHGMMTHNHGFYNCDTSGEIRLGSDFPTSITDNNQKKAWLENHGWLEWMQEEGNLDYALEWWDVLPGGACPYTSGHGTYTSNAHTIREKEADAALREALKALDTVINDFASSKGISLTQGQHDALVLFSFENGTAWTKGNDDLQTAVVNGTTGWDFVKIMRNWNSSDDNNRRDVECNMYLNGKYNSSASALKVEEKTSDSEALVTDDWVKVTVTNAYINVREKASIFGKQVGTVYKGDVLLVTGTENANGYLWGHFMNEDYKEVGYVALMYTSYDEVIAADKYQKEQAAASASKVMGTATVSVNGYVNVRSGAGTSNAIVSSLRNGTRVELYEIQYVNGQRWGRTNVGWFSLAYAKDLKISDYGKVNTNDYGYVNYLFTGTLKAGAVRYADLNSNPDTADADAYTETDSRSVKIGRVISYNGETWGKSSEGWNKPWFKLDEHLELDTATYTTIAETSVRASASSGAARLQTLEKGTEFDITEIKVNEDTVWGYAEASGDMKYDGWINLSTKYVTRKGATLKDDGDSEKCTLATAKVDVNIRKKANIFGDKVGTLPAGTTVQVLEGPVNGTRMTGWYRLKFTNGSGTESWARGDNLNIFEGTRADITYGKTPTSPSGTQAATGKGMVANTYGGVNVRTAPGTANAKVTKLLPGTEVDILEVTYYGATKWGRIEQGWLCMDYIAMMDYDDLPSSSSTVTSSTQAVYTGHVTDDVPVYKDTKVIDTNFVRTLNSGDVVTVYELLTVKEVVWDDGTTSTTTTFYWARVNDGYILLDGDPIALNPLDEVDYTVTETDLLKIREDAGTSNDREDMDLKKGDQVKVTNVKIVDDQFWGKIEDKDLTDGNGWICLSYCTKGAVSVGSNESSNNAGSDNTTSGGSTTTTTPTTMSIGNTGKGTYSGKVIGSAQVQEVNVRKEPSTSSTEVTKLRKGTAITITETKLVDGRSWGYCGSGWINLLYVDLTPVGITAIDAKVIAVDNTLVYESSETGAKVVGSYANRAVVNIYEEMNGMYKTDMGWISKGNCL